MNKKWIAVIAFTIISVSLSAALYITLSKKESPPPEKIVRGFIGEDVSVADKYDDIVMLSEVLDDNDVAAFIALENSRRILHIVDKVPVEVIVIGDSPQFCQVKILRGEYRGRVVWTFSGFVRNENGTQIMPQS